MIRLFKRKDNGYKRLNAWEFIQILRRADLGNGRPFNYERVLTALVLHFRREGAKGVMFQFHAAKCNEIADVIDDALQDRGYYDCDII